MAKEKRRSVQFELERVLGQTDMLRVDTHGALMIDGVRASALVCEFGAPLFVVCEATFRKNLRRFAAAFERVWPNAVEVLYAVKANPSPALCRVASEEGAGFDCTGYGELALALEYGQAPSKTTLNGSNKTDAEIAYAIERDSVVVLDAEEDLEVVSREARRQRRKARVAIRLKAFNERALTEFRSDAYPTDQPLAVVLAQKKWGVGIDGATRLVERALGCPDAQLVGYHVHIGRLARDPLIIGQNVRAFAEIICILQKCTGFAPSLIDIGGGWPADRDPEARTTAVNPTPIERYARVACGALSGEFETAGLPMPRLWLEPGRYLVNNAGLLLTRVGRIKKDAGRTWVNIDASGEWLVLATHHRSENLIVPIEDMGRPLRGPIDIVGPNCIPAVFARNRLAPDFRSGEVAAILDAGAYGESQASQFNSMPRPATVLVSNGAAELIRRRETFDDLLAPHLIPRRLRAEARAGKEGANSFLPDE